MVRDPDSSSGLYRDCVGIHEVFIDCISDGVWLMQGSGARVPFGGVAKGIQIKL